MVIFRVISLLLKVLTSLNIIYLEKCTSCIYFGAVKQLIASKIKVFVYIINMCVPCIFIMSI